MTILAAIGKTAPAALVTSIRRLFLLGLGGCLVGLAICRAGTESSAATEPYHVGVWFFTLWSNASHGTQAQQSQRVYGRADSWGGVRDYAEGHGIVPIVDPVTGKPVNFTDRRPLLGFYDLRNSKTVAAEIDEAASEGIEFFAFYWYFSAQTGAEEDVSAPVRLFFDSSARRKIKLVLAPIAVRDFHDNSGGLAPWIGKTVPLLVNYMMSDDYLRVDGRPLVLDYGLNFAKPGDLLAAYTALRRTVQSIMGVDPMIIHVIPGTAKFGDEAYFAREVRPDGFTCFANPVRGAAEPYAEYVADWIPAMTAQITAPHNTTVMTPSFFPCGSIGFDPRPWYHVGEGWGSSPNAMRFTSGTTPTLWRRHLETLKRYVDAHRCMTKGIVLLYAWNEWGEAAADIEPSKTRGYAYGDVVREVFSLRPRSPRPPPN
jgi:hypothetical protein